MALDAGPPCKDCVAEGVTTKRPAKRPGPRCATHQRAHKQATKATNHERMVVKTYGIAPGDYDKMYMAQGGVCFICRRANGRTKKLAVDHNHDSGAVRGLLCSPDNRYIGYQRNDPSALLRAAVYLCEHDPEKLAALAAYLQELSQA